MSGADLRRAIAARLDPIETYDPLTRSVSSDFDLNPHPAPLPQVLAPAAVLVALVEHESGPTVLLTRRSDTMRSHTGQIALPGGRSDPGEAPWQTALREAQEEIGLEPDLVSVAGLSSAYHTGSGFDITPVVGFVKPGFVLKPNPAEVADIFETPFAFLMNPVNHERRFLDGADGQRRHFYAMSYEERVIWGATAGILRALYQRLGDVAAA